MSTIVDKRRPTRAEIEPAALDVIRRRGPEILATARRYATTEHDAEDAYQRGLEILLTKAPSTREDDLVPWLKTVVKHEAFAIRKQRERHGVPSERDELAPAPTDTHEQVERLDRLGRGAEALNRLKPAETRCLLLLAAGHSYAEICAITGFSYTKVNRCLAEGRQSFMQRLDGIESGAECARLAPLISAAADGEAAADEMLLLRRHMRGCLACRASLREARHVPARVAALAPAGIALAPSAGGGHVHAAWSWLHERVATFAVRGQELAEAATAHKAAALAASAAALAGGGAVTVKAVTEHHPHQHAATRPAAVAAPVRTAPVARPAPTFKRPAPHRARSHTRVVPPSPEPTTAAPDPRPATPHDAASPARTSPATAPSRSGSGAGEFGP